MSPFSEPGIYNVLDAPYNLSSDPGANPVVNAMGLQSAVTDAEANGGGTILIPSNDTLNNKNVFRVQPPTTGTPVVSISGSYPILILGTGGPTLRMMASGTLFSTPATTPFFTGASLAFQDLFIEYASDVTGIALDLENCTNARIFRVFFNNCQIPVKFYSIAQGSMLQCTVQYQDSYNKLNGATCVDVGESALGPSSQIDIDTCIFRANSNNVPVNSTGLSLSSVDGLRLRNTYLTNFVSGIFVSPSAGSECKNVIIDTVVSAAMMKARPFQSAGKYHGGVIA